MISLSFATYRQVFLYGGRVESMAAHLAQVVRDRRTRLDLTQEQAAARSGGLVTTPSWRAIEGGKRSKVRDPTKKGLERALWWAEGSVDSVLAGGEATVDPERPVPSYIGDPVGEHELPPGGHLLTTADQVDREFGHFLHVLDDATTGIKHSKDMAHTFVHHHTQVYVRFVPPKFEFRFETPDWDAIGLGVDQDQFAVAAEGAEGRPPVDEGDEKFRPGPPSEDEDS